MQTNPGFQKEQHLDLDPAYEAAFQLHIVDLFKTQTSHQGNSTVHPDVFVLIRYPELANKTGCINTYFQTGRLLFTHDQILSTGSPLLEWLLLSEKHQKQAKEAAGSLPDGVSSVLDLSPTIDEIDYTTALHHLTITTGIKLWYRTMADGNSPLTVAGHDDVCNCNAQSTRSYPEVQRPLYLLHGPKQDIYDTASWPIEDHYDIRDFCPVRWASNTIRLLQAIDNSSGQKKLLIDSPP